MKEDVVALDRLNKRIYDLETIVKELNVKNDSLQNQINNIRESVKFVARPRRI